MQVELALWDTAGQEDYDQLRRLSYIDADLILICYAVDVVNSFHNVQEHWTTEASHHAPRVPLMLVGCKADLRAGSVQNGANSNALVTTQEGRAMAGRIGAAGFAETSAKNGTVGFIPKTCGKSDDSGYRRPGGHLCANRAHPHSPRREGHVLRDPLNAIRAQ